MVYEVNFRRNKNLRPMYLLYAMLVFSNYNIRQKQNTLDKKNSAAVKCLETKNFGCREMSPNNWLRRNRKSSAKFTAVCSTGILKLEGQRPSLATK